MSSAPLRILLICTHFPPLNRTGARRPYYLARELRDRGHHVFVLTSEEVDDATWNVDMEGIDVLRYARTHIQRDMSGWQRLIARAHYRWRNTMIHAPLRVLADMVLPLNHDDRWDLTPQEIEQRTGRPDIVVSTGPAWSVAQFGMRLARRSDATFIVDYRDPWSISDPAVHMDIVSGTGAGLAGLLRRTAFRLNEQRIGRAAYALTAVTPPVLLNAQAVTKNERGAAFPGGYVAGPVPLHHEQNEKFTLVYTGRLYSEQDWDLTLEAITRMSCANPDLHRCFTLKLIGAVSTDHILLDRIADTARRTGAVQMLPRMTREDALQEQQRADALLHLAYRGRKGYLPVKFLEYLGSGRPILLITREKDLMEEILTTTRTGALIPDAKTLTEFLTARLVDRQSGQAWSISPDRDELHKYQYPVRMRPWADQILAWDNERRSTGTTSAMA